MSEAKTKLDTWMKISDKTPLGQWEVKIGEITLLYISLSGGWFFYTKPGTNELRRYDSLLQAVNSIKTMLEA